jgi:hypothetical protein
MRILTWPDDSGKEKATKSDRNWFEKHPKRRWRIRPFIKDEDNGVHSVPPRGFRAFTFIERLPSGGFVRRFFVTCHGQPSNCDRVAALISALWKFAGEETAVVDIPPNSELKRQIDFAVTIAPIAGDDPEEAFQRTVCEALNPMGAAR